LGFGPPLPVSIVACSQMAWLFPRSLAHQSRKTWVQYALCTLMFPLCFVKEQAN
jgi:hypothetical protein